MIATRKSGAVVRAFFALDLPSGLREACAALAEQLRRAPGGDGVRFVRPGGYHLTLRFLGNVEAERLEDLSRQVAGEVASARAFSFRLGAPQGFPSARRPRVIALPAEPAEQLAALAARVDAGAVAAGLPAEPRAFRAHLTLGRVRNRRIPSLDGAALPAGLEAPVREVVLYRSDLSREGAVYTALERLALGTVPRAADLTPETPAPAATRPDGPAPGSPPGT